MSRGTIKEIANALRKQINTTTTYTLEQMVSAINNLNVTAYSGNLSNTPPSNVYKLYDKAQIQSIANAIKAKTGLSSIYLSQMPSAILNMSVNGSGGGGEVTVYEATVIVKGDLSGTPYYRTSTVSVNDALSKVSQDISEMLQAFQNAGENYYISNKTTTSQTATSITQEWTFVKSTITYTATAYVYSATKSLLYSKTATSTVSEGQALISARADCNSWIQTNQYVVAASSASEFFVSRNISVYVYVYINGSQQTQFGGQAYYGGKNLSTVQSEALSNAKTYLANRGYTNYSESGWSWKNGNYNTTEYTISV